MFTVCVRMHVEAKIHIVQHSECFKAVRQALRHLTGFKQFLEPSGGIKMGLVLNQSLLYILSRYVHCTCTYTEQLKCLICIRLAEPHD